MKIAKMKSEKWPEKSDKLTTRACRKLCKVAKWLLIGEWLHHDGTIDSLLCPIGRVVCTQNSVRWSGCVAWVAAFQSLLRSSIDSARRNGRTTKQIEVSHWDLCWLSFTHHTASVKCHNIVAYGKVVRLCLFWKSRIRHLNFQRMQFVTDAAAEVVCPKFVPKMSSNKRGAEQNESFLIFIRFFSAFAEREKCQAIKKNGRSFIFRNRPS